LRHRRKTAIQIAHRPRVPRSTVAAVLERCGLERLSRLNPKPPPVHYERERKGEILHPDVKELGQIRDVGHPIPGDRGTHRRGIGWEFVHVRVDHHSRPSYAEALSDERADTAEVVLRRALRWFRRRGLPAQADNGSCYVSNAINQALQELGVRHLYPKPYRPQNDGKGERCIQTMLREWA